MNQTTKVPVVYLVQTNQGLVCAVYGNKEAATYHPDKTCSIIPWQVMGALAVEAKERCFLCSYQHGHAIGCANNPVDVALKKQEQAEPVAWYDGRKFYGSQDAASVDCANMAALQPLYAAQPAQPVAAPDGWKLVPVEPTSEMLDAAAHASMQHLLDCINDPKLAHKVGSEEMVRLTHASRYRTMLAASPSPAAREPNTEVQRRP